MWTSLIVGCCLGIIVHGGIIARPSYKSAITKPSPPYNMTNDLVQISKTCLTNGELGEMTGTKLPASLAPVVSWILARSAKNVIGVQELRSSLGYPPSGPFNRYRKVNKKWIAAAPTVKAYYELVEPRSNVILNENLKSLVAFLDKRVPEIRTVFRRKFSEIRHRPDAPVKIDREEVDLMIKELVTITESVGDAVFTMFLDLDCLRKEQTKEKDEMMKREKIDCPDQDSCIEPTSFQSLSLNINGETVSEWY